MPKEITKDSVKERKFDKSDYLYLSEYIIELYKERKHDRKELEEQWKDIDRQLLMKPDNYHKLDANGRLDINKAWMPEVELPLQSQTLEITTADARRMQFPDAGPWFAAHAALTDDYLSRVDFQSIITGDQMEVPSQITQDNADKLVQGVLNNYHRQYPFHHHMDLINSESVKYSMGIGKARVINKQIITHTRNGVMKSNQAMPVLVPRSIKNIYLDTNVHNLMNEGIIVGSSIINYKVQAWADLMMAAVKGSSDPNDPDGGWMPKNIKDVEKDKHGNIVLLELEGDLLVPRKTTESLYVPNVTITVCMGDREATMNVVRLRFNKYPQSSYIQFPYQNEHIENPYGTSPLMKGRPIQKAAVEALIRMMMVAALRSQPPVSRPADDVFFNQQRGIPMFPGADWPTTGEVRPHQIGDPTAMMQIYIGLLQQYADVTGVNAPRLGAQTISHTTAYAKQAELSRGTVRTVDFVKSSLLSLNNWLDLEFKMARDNIKSMPIYLDDYGGYVNIDKKTLPDLCVFDVYGSGGPAEESNKRAQRLQAIQLVLSLQQLRVGIMSANAPTNLDFDKIEELILREGGITDLDAILKQAPPPLPGQSNVPPAVSPGGALESFGQAASFR